MRLIVSSKFADILIDIGVRYEKKPEAREASNTAEFVPNVVDLGL